MTALEAAKLNINDELITLIDTHIGPKGTKVYYQGVGWFPYGVVVSAPALHAHNITMSIDDLMHVPSLVVPNAQQPGWPIGSTVTTHASATPVVAQVVSSTPSAHGANNPGDCYWHTWAKYVGFTEIYEYCTSCGVKSFSDK